MRLIDVDTLEFEWFSESELPRYVILSHTWGEDEVSYQDMCWLQKTKDVPQRFQEDPAYSILLGASFPGITPTSEEELKGRTGYAKIIETANIAKERDYKYIWIDTCCIDKSSSAELQEAINSMYRWYQSSALCAVYLNDTGPDSKIDDPSYFESALKHSKWIKRGWTLQELIAPDKIFFFDRHWRPIGSKHRRILDISEATGIPVSVLEDRDLSKPSIAQKMSWAAGRTTTRVEDVAYSLMGLFGIHMPMLYGEGENAFLRLQEEIIKHSSDHTIFAWRADTGDFSTYRGLLARSPKEFRDCGDLESDTSRVLFPTIITSLGVNLTLNLKPMGPRDCYLARLCAKYQNNSVAIVLMRLPGTNQQFTRVDTKNRVFLHDDTPTGTPQSVYVRQSPLIGPQYFIDSMDCFHLLPRLNTRSAIYMEITQCWPGEYWSLSEKELRIPSGVNFFFGILWLQPYNDLMPETQTSLDPFQLILGISKPCRPWCKFVDWTPEEWYEILEESYEPWESVVDALGGSSECRTADKKVWRIRDSPQDSIEFDVINVSIESALYMDKVSLLVHLENLD